MSKGDNVDMLKGDDIDPHTISYNKEQYYIDSWTNTEHAREEDEFKEVEENEREINQVYSFLYPSSIVDPVERKKAEDYVKNNFHRLSYTDRQRIMYPDLNKHWFKK